MPDQRQQGLEFGPVLVSRQSQTQRHEQVAARQAGLGLDGSGPCAPCGLVPRLLRQQGDSRGQQSGIGCNGSLRAFHDLPPDQCILQACKIAAHRQPEGLVGGKAQGLQAVLDRGEIGIMQQTGVEMVQFGLVETGGRPRQAAEIDQRSECRERGNRPHRFR